MERESTFRLLLVDDEVEFLSATAKALSRRGFTVTTAENGQQAMELLEIQEFDVAIVDVKMPGIPGDQLFREIKRRWPRVPTIILTGHGTVEQAFRTSKDGIFDYLPKPCDVEKLAQIARKAIEEFK